MQVEGAKWAGPEEVGLGTIDPGLTVGWEGLEGTGQQEQLCLQGSTGGPGGQGSEDLDPGLELGAMSQASVETWLLD